MLMLFYDLTGNPIKDSMLQIWSAISCALFEIDHTDFKTYLTI